jgi:hypothetical protein
MNVRLRNISMLMLLAISIFAVIDCSDDNGVSINDNGDDNGSDHPIRNIPPETWLSASIVEESEFDKRIHFFWNGWDIDGAVISYQWAVSILDTILEWSTIYRQDSIFVFAIDPEFPIDRHFMVRSIDDDGMMDPTPSSYLIPSK